jgi:hypothetical protein
MYGSVSLVTTGGAESPMLPPPNLEDNYGSVNDFLSHSQAPSGTATPTYSGQATPVYQGLADFQSLESPNQYQDY